MIHLLYDSNAIWKHSCYAIEKINKVNKCSKETQNLSARHLFEPKINVVAFVLSKYIEDMCHRVLGREYLFAFYTVSKKSSGFMPHLHQSLSAGDWFILTTLNAATDLYFICVQCSLWNSEYKLCHYKLKYYSNGISFIYEGEAR